MVYCKGRSKVRHLLHVVLLKRMVRRWRRIHDSLRKIIEYRKSGGYLNLECAIPSDVPKGHLPVYVGSHRSRFIIPATYLNHGLLRPLLDKAEEEFGVHQEMGLAIPCDELSFQNLISCLDGRETLKLAESTMAC